MALLVSSWAKGVKSVPKDYVMPPEKRAGDFVTIGKEIPVIDLHNDRSHIVQEIRKACQEFGLFQVINHGVPDKMMKDMKVLYDEFFNLPVEDKLGVYSEKYRSGCVLYTSTFDYTTENFHYWKDSLKHSCHPLEKHSPSWPDKPNRYREEVGRYVIEVRKMGFQILDLIAEGLGLNEGYFNNGVSQEHTLAVNHYPPCPNPSLAMGLAAHSDPNLITFLQQDTYGLQINKDGKWMGVDLIPNAFVVNLGYVFEVVSNGQLKSVEHRVVLNSTASRTSIGTFFGPGHEPSVVVEPAKELVTSSNPQMFKSYRQIDFMKDYFAFNTKPTPHNGTLLDSYRLQSGNFNTKLV